MISTTVIIIIGFLIIVIVGIVSPLWPYLIGAAWSPTSRRVVDKMLSMAEVTSKDTVYDLGSGDGRILIAASRGYHARAVGIEADPIRILWSYLNLFRHGLHHRVRLIWGNLFNKDLSDATVVTLFLWKTTNQRLKPKLSDELRPGTRVVSYLWAFHGWEPIKMDIDDEIFLYEIGESDQSKN